MFKIYKTKVENQLGKRNKSVKSDHEGEYYSRNDSLGEQCSGPFAKFLKDYGIIPQYIMPGSPGKNG